MKRLTERHSAGYDLKAMNGEWCDRYCSSQRAETCNECAIYEAIQRLAYYEDLEEQGRLLIVERQEVHPCRYCTTGWGYADGKGCYDTCEKLKQYSNRHSN